MMEGTKINEENAGEIEIERIPTRMIEARSKGLVPVVDYLQTPKIKQTRFTKFYEYLFCRFWGCGCCLYLTLFLPKLCFRCTDT